jgi:hypothetical protein
MTVLYSMSRAAFTLGGVHQAMRQSVAACCWQFEGKQQESTGVELTDSDGMLQHSTTWTLG